MNLKEKFEQYQTEYDQKAWQDFNRLRKQKISTKTKNNMNGNNLLLIISAILLASLAAISGVAFFNFQQNINKNNASALINATKSIKNETGNISVETITDKFEKEKIKKNPQNILPLKETLTTQAFKQTLERESDNQKEFVQNTALPNLENEDNIDNNYSTNKTGAENEANNIIKHPIKALNLVQPFSNKLKASFIVDKSSKLLSNKAKHAVGSDKNFIAKNEILGATQKASTSLNSEQIDFINEPSTGNFSTIIAPLPLIESLLQTNSSLNAPPQNIIEVSDEIYNNTFKLNINYVPDFFVNGYVPDANPVKIRGYFVDLDYRRRLNKLLSVGFGLGYSFGKDRNNPQLDTLDYVRNAHAHLRVQLFFLNNTNNRLFIKGGTGLSYTGRLLSYDINEMTRGFMESKFYYMGFTLEAAYERNITKQLFVGLQVGLSSGNDGFAYPGVSVGYNF